MGRINYQSYIQIQTSAPIKKPKRYRDGQRIAIEWFFKGINRESRVLDVGCGLGWGMRKLKDMGFKDVYGIELNRQKVEICKRRGLEVICDDIGKISSYKRYYDIFWLSHSFEHTWDANKALEDLKLCAVPHSLFFFVLPYPDSNPAPAHTASIEIGLNVSDWGETLVKWFSVRGLGLIEKKFDNYREPEIWMKFRKI